MHSAKPKAMTLSETLRCGAAYVWQLVRHPAGDLAHTMLVLSYLCAVVDFVTWVFSVRASQNRAPHLLSSAAADAAFGCCILCILCILCIPMLHAVHSVHSDAAFCAF